MQVFKRKPLYLFLLPIFFVFNGYTRFYPLVPVKGAVLLLLLYFAGGLVLTAIAWLFLRNINKAALLAGLLLGYQFFFGIIHEQLNSFFPGSMISRYVFIIPFSFLVFFFLAWWIKKKSGPTLKLIFYLNSIFVLLIGIDVARLITKGAKSNGKNIYVSDTGLKPLDQSSSPDIYFIILDGYSGSDALTEAFQFDNSYFEKMLAKKGFHVFKHSMSNYNFTPFSIASMLNMKYLDLDMEAKAAGNLGYCYRMIWNSRVVNFFNDQGYEFKNYSIFDFPGKPAKSENYFLPTGTRLITAHTFSGRVQTDLIMKVRTGKLHIKKIQKRILYSHLYKNEKFIRLTVEAAGQKSVSPRFFYTHLMLPHHPYYFDSKGTPLPMDSLIEGHEKNKHYYTEYLQYCNKKILDLTDGILNRSASPPVIILTSDHGFRSLPGNENRQYCFSTIAAFYLPGANKTELPDSISAVNIFPEIFNTQFHQQIKLKKDSTIFLWD